MINLTYIPFILIICIVAFVLVKAHSDPKESFSIFHLVSTSGKGSLEKVIMLLAGLSVTWWFVDLVATGKAGLEEALAYGGLMGLAKIARDVVTLKTPQPPTPPSE